MTAGPEVTFEYVAAVRSPHPDGVTAVMYHVRPPAGWIIEKVIIDGDEVTVGVTPREGGEHNDD